MRTFEENIGGAIQDSSLSFDNSPVNMPKDPFKKTMDEFEKDLIDTDLSEQNIENSELTSARDLINQEAANAEINLKTNDSDLIVKKIIEKLKEKNLYTPNCETEVRIAIGYRRQFLQNIRERELDNKEREKTREDSSEFRKMAIRSAEWRGMVIDAIIENRGNPDEIKRFWKNFDNLFLKFKEADDEGLEKYSSIQSPDSFRRGVLAEIAAMDLSKELAEETIKKSEKKAKVNIKFSTPEEDVIEKIDFLIVISFGNYKKEIPCQVKSCYLPDLISERKEPEKIAARRKYVEENVIVDYNYFKGMPRNEYSKKEKPNYQKKVEDKMEEFFKKNKGIFMVLPFGKIEKQGHLENYIEEDGTPSNNLKELLSFEVGMKDIRRIFLTLDTY